jgi:hypothetical protein
MSNFIQACIAGDAQLEDIDDFVDQWHGSKVDGELHEFLGMTTAEYGLWMVDASVLQTIVDARRRAMFDHVQRFKQATDGPDAFDDSGITAYCGKLIGSDGPGTEEFGRQLKIIASAMGKIGSVANAANLNPRRIGGSQNLPEDVLAARVKITEAHMLLLEAEALMRSAHVAAIKK